MIGASRRVLDSLVLGECQGETRGPILMLIQVAAARALARSPRRREPAHAAARTALVRLLDSAVRLDHHRLRATRGWRTAVTTDESTPHWSVHLSRNRFYATAHCRIVRAVLHSNTGRARLRATRRAVLHALEDFKLITITRGGVPRPAPFAEDVL